MNFRSPFFSNLREHAFFKLCWHAGLGLWIAFFYFAPQRWPIFSAQPAPTLGWDLKIPFQPAWAPFYQSIFITHTLSIWLPRQRRAVQQYGLSIMAAYVISALIFWVYPTLSPRPDECNLPLYRWLIADVDGMRNALPSLHAAIATFSAVQLERYARSFRSGPFWRVVLSLWFGTLLYSTLATRQHRILDLVAGVALAAALIPVSRRCFAMREDEDAGATG